MHPHYHAGHERAHVGQLLLTCKTKHRSSVYLSHWHSGSDASHCCSCSPPKRFSHVLCAPAGAEAPLLSDVSLALPPRSLGLVYGRSGAGKTTLLQLLAGLQQPTAGSIAIGAGVQGPGQGAAQGLGQGAAQGLGQGAAQGAAQRLARVGLVFQFPERHFLGDTLQEARLALCVCVACYYGCPSSSFME